MFELDKLESKLEIFLKPKVLVMETPYNSDFYLSISTRTISTTTLHGKGKLAHVNFILVQTQAHLKQHFTMKEI